MKIFTAYLAHETNSFSPLPTNLASFEELGIYRPRSMGPTTDRTLLKVAAPFYDEAVRRGDEVLVGLCAHAQPSRPTQRADYERLRDWLLADLADARDRLDLVLVTMHGAMMADGYDDCEGDMLIRMRTLVGPHVPIGVLLDLHCNITPAMLEHATVINACKEYPHTDFADRARELYDICSRIRRGQVQPTIGFVRVPMFGLFQTAQQPMRTFIDSLLALEQAPGVLSVTLAHGFPWSDFAQAGASVLVVTDRDQAQADRLARRIGREFFELRESGQVRLASIDEAIDQACGVTDGTRVIADMADNPGGGAPSDSTFILARLLARGVRDAAVAYLWDPVAVDLAFAAGEGSKLPLRIGGKVGPQSGQPLDVEATIVALRNDAVQAHIADGEPVRLGRTAIVHTRGVDIVLNDIRQQPFTPEGLTACGMDPWSKRILVVKSTHHFYEAFHRRARQIIYCDAPGMLNSNIRELPFCRITRPIWPLDDIDPDVADGV
jgi:microcystin degradation protein MlrC